MSVKCLSFVDAMSSLETADLDECALSPEAESLSPVSREEEEEDEDEESGLDTLGLRTPGKTDGYLQYRSSMNGDAVSVEDRNRFILALLALLLFESYFSAKRQSRD